MKGILEGVRVLDFTRYISGPYCTQMLADMGAEVIKIEKPGEGDVSRYLGPFKDDASMFFLMANRNKKSITVDTRSPEGIELIKRLVKEADVVVENFRAGTMEKMGLGYDVLKEINPAIIMTSITGFGQDGPLRDRPAFDGIISSLSGVTRIENGKVERSKGAIHDHIAGTYAVIGTLLALMEKAKTGKGQFVDVAMIACSMLIRNDSIGDTFFNGEEAALLSDDSAPYGYLKAADGFVNFHAGPDQMFARLLTFCEEPLLHEERFKDINVRIQHKDELFDAVQHWADGKTCDELESTFLKANIPAGIVATPGRLLNNQHMWDTGLMQRVPFYGLDEPVPQIGFPVRMSEHRDIEYRRPPLVGENTDEIFRSALNMSDEELAELRGKGVI